MEPVKGGKLANLPDDAKQVLLNLLTNAIKSDKLSHAYLFNSTTIGQWSEKLTSGIIDTLCKESLRFSVRM